MEKSILITGSSSGIGLCTCQYLKSKGYRVFGTARSMEAVNSLKEQGIEAFQLDVNNSLQIKEVVNAITELTSGTLYALCNNAGFGQPGALEDLDRASLTAQFETNVFGLLELTNAVLPIMRRQGYGRIINLSSVLGFIALPFRGAYAASKYAVEGLTDSLRLELRNTLIYVSLIEPGMINTKFRDSALSAYSANIKDADSPFSDQYQRFLHNFTTNKLQRLGTGPIVVAKKIEHALESKRPKIRYRVTAATHLMATLKRLLPDRALDLILAKIADQEIN